MHSGVFDWYSIEVGADIVIGGIQYHTLQVPFVQSGSNGVCPFYQVGYKGAFRQDTALRKVYIIPPGDTLEQIFYDFSLEIGDTVRGYIQRYVNPNETIIDIDSVQVGADYRKRWLVNPMYQICLVEGVGWLYGLIEPSPSQLLDAFNYQLMCFSQDGNVLFPLGTSSCGLIDNINTEDVDNRIAYYPNPTQSVTTFKLHAAVYGFKYTLIDVFGRVLDENIINVNKNFEYDFSPIQNGIYFMEIYTGDGKIHSLKIIKE